jgi:hypothetical protein
MPYVQSAALEQVSYDEASHSLRATMRDGHRTFVYEEVPQDVYDGLIFADSISRYFNAHIRGQFPYHEEPHREN